MESPKATVDHLRAMLAAGIFLDPLLASNYLKNTGQPRVTYLRARARDMSGEMYERWVDENTLGAGQTVPGRPFAPTLMRLCFYEALISTAVTIAHEESGMSEPDEAALETGRKKLHAFVDQVGALALYNLYFTIAGYDALQPLYLHKDVSEQEFLSGIRHHPYFPENLELFLLIGLGTQSLRLKTIGDTRTVQITRLGTSTYLSAREMLRESGYFNKRLQFAYVYQFDTVEDWDKLCGAVWPTVHRLRKEYLDFVGELLGKRVLEVACGTGALTFDAGLYERVGGAGRLVAFDLSAGMLDEARKKFERVGQPTQVQFQLGTVENMPFSDRSFDACVGSGFIHFVDPVVTLREMARTVVTGGIVSIYQGTEFSLDQPFFQDWFEPIFALARHRNARQPKNYMPKSGEVLEQWFEQAGLRDVKSIPSTLEWVFDDPETVVQHIVRGVSFFEAELMELPWDDRRAVVSELIDRGHDVRARYSLTQRTIALPMHSIKGTVR